MTEERLLASLNPSFKDKYIVEWCNLCRSAVITCSKCRNSSCNGGGCPECIEDFREFNNRKVTIEQYLTPEETYIYHKIEAIKKLMLETLGNSPEIDFKQIKQDGGLSRTNEILFQNFL